MLRTTTLRFPLRTIVPCARRGFAYSVCLRNPSSTSSFPTAAAAQAQAHEKKDESVLTKPDGISTVPQKASKVQGDWVLFHPVYTPSELRAVQTIHQKPKTFPDKIAYGLVRFSRKMFDVVSRYTAPEGEPKPGMTLEELRKKGFSMTEGQWLTRILFLESIAGVPGMVAASVRHLQSLRLMRRDNGWIHTCLEEAENERMHLMTFITVKKPSIWIRGLILGAQGVYYNLFFLSYLFAPRVCHRFVGYLEEEAVHTYTRAIADVEAGLFPEWHNRPAPEIAIDYWRLPSTATMLDVLYAVRSDETSHRFVNHSLANLNPATDVNPFALREPGMDVKGGKISFDRDESEEFVVRSHEIVRKELEKMK